MIFVSRIWLRDGDDGNGTNETSDVVHVAMRIIPGYATVHPQNLVDAEIVVEDALQILAGKARIALLHSAQQALLGCDEGAAPVDVNASTFQNHAVVGWKHRSPAGQAEQFGSLRRQLVVQLPVRILRPGIEVPVGDTDR